MDLHDIRFTDINITSGGYPIRINIEEGVQLKRLARLFFSNIQIKSKLPITLNDSIEDIHFDNITTEPCLL